MIFGENSMVSLQKISSNLQYGTTPLIRQCVTPGMMAMHEGRTYRVSAVIQERKWVYLHTDAEIIRLSDCVIDVLLDGHGNPIQH